MPPVPPLEICLFGSITVAVHGAPLPRFRSRSVGWLLALLALRAGRAVERSRLAGWLWPESSEETALRNLRDNLMHLRRALGPEAERLQSPSRDRIALATEGAVIDVLEFDRAIAAGDEPSLAQAVERYAGPLLDDCLEDWAARERDSRAAACLAALERLGEAAEACGEWATALQQFRKAEALDPLRDSGVRGIMRALAGAGDLPEAVHAYREFRLRLHRELNAEPDPDTTRLFQQLRDRTRGSAPARPAAPPVEPSVPEALEPRPGLPALPAAAALPHPLTGLIGREAELGAVTEMLQASRLVTIVGGGGLGKTRLAVEVGRRLTEEFAEGVAFVPLAALSDPRQLPAFLAELFGADQKGATTSITAIAARLAGAELLLVLDNCEHLVDEAALLAQSLLEQCPRLRILATSRQRLGIVGEVVWRIPSLAAPEEGSLAQLSNPAELLAAYPAARLLLERLEMVQPGFRIRRLEEARAVAQICRRLDGIPLALELAAARATHLTVEQIAARLDDRFRLLTGGNRGVLPRHRTLRTLVDWSYDLLDERQKLLFRRLAVFAGGWTMEAAEGICAGSPDVAGGDDLAADEVLDLLTGLVEQSLVQVEERDGISRYQWLETLREYALERLRASGEETWALRAHRDYFLALAEARTAELRGPEQARSLEVLRREFGNLRAALAFCREDPESAVSGLRLATVLRSYWLVRGQYREGWEHLQAALARAVPEGEPYVQQVHATALYGAGAMALELGQPDAAERLVQQGHALYEGLNDLQGVGRMQTLLGSIALVRDRPAEATPYYLRALELSRQRGDVREEAINVCNLGAVSLALESYADARTYYQQALDTARVAGDASRDGFLTTYLALAHLGAGELAAATALQAEAVRMALPLSNTRLTVELLELSAAISSVRGELVRALHCYGAAESLRREHQLSPRSLQPSRKQADLAAAAAALGTAACEAALAEGRAASVEQILSPEIGCGIHHGAHDDRVVTREG
ncbi:MAG: transcriptional activator domain protein [Armatimonadetes bacterium]|jgi:predicted ATPase/DNA-binding SARP family transcriptional activator|nr:transcriptional activator domain protein [Armatimonadota bacterium]